MMKITKDEEQRYERRKKTKQWRGGSSKSAKERKQIMNRFSKRSSRSPLIKQRKIKIVMVRITEICYKDSFFYPNSLYILSLIETAARLSTL